MAKKVLLTVFAIILFFLALATTGLAESNMTTKLGNEVTSSVNKTEKSMEDLARKTENKAVAGKTGNYATGEIQTIGQQARNGMTSNAWIWIVMAVVALIIIAAVWFYATQQNQRQQ